MTRSPASGASFRSSATSATCRPARASPSEIMVTIGSSSGRSWWSINKLNLKKRRGPRARHMWKDKDYEHARDEFRRMDHLLDHSPGHPIGAPAGDVQFHRPVRPGDGLGGARD